MIYEVAAAVEHIVSLVQQGSRAQPIATEALAGFSSTLKDVLERRCQRSWRPSEPECGSAFRSVAWQMHSAGEGADVDLLGAFASVVQAQAEEGELVRSHLALALEWLPTPFTLWIDPGCVAIRMGPGPGASRAYDGLDGPASIHVVWGSMIANTGPVEKDLPQLTVSIAPRPIPIVKPVPGYQNIGNGVRHSRSSSSSSWDSSACGLVRSVSLSSTVSTDATSISSNGDREECPSLCSPFSSRASSQSTPSDPIHDTTIGDTTERFTGIRLFDVDHDDDDDEGDLTIGPVLAQVNEVETVRCNYTTHDNGNVGVLGGGVKLGGASSKHRASKSVSGVPALLPSHLPRGMPLRHYQHMSGGYNGVPLRTAVMVPQDYSYQGYHQQPQHYPVVPPHGGMQYAPHPPMPYPLANPPPQQQYGIPFPSVARVSPEEEGDEEGDPSRRRTRSRGRRSRGRGAGRGARRQAAQKTEELSRSTTPSTLASTNSSVYSSATTSPVKGSLSKRTSTNNLSIKLDNHHSQAHFAMRLTATLAGLIA